MGSTPPAWFTRAVALEFADVEVEVDGCRIHALTAGPEARPALVFVHGGGAHARWWTPVAAQFAAEYRVVCLDLSGHGDSGRRDRYSLEQWTDEVAAVAAATAEVPRPVVIGHSMGGFVTIATAARHADALGGAIICDSPVTQPDPEVGAYRLREAFGRSRTYGSIDEAVARFRTIPPQEHYLDYVVDYVARHSLRRSDDGLGWSWKFDPTVFQPFGSSIRAVALPYLAQVRCRLALLRSEFGLVTEDIGLSMYEAMGRVTPVIELPEAGHHAMLDQPLILLTALRSLLSDWEHSVPTPRRREP